MNSFRTALLLGALTGLLMLIGGYFGGRGGVVLAFVFAMVMNFGSYWFSDKIVLRMYRAQEVTEAQAPDLYHLVKNLALKASLPMPKVYIIPEDTPNAFATGRNEQHAVVAVTEGILRILNQDELEGVLAHELTHIKNRDILIGSIAATLAGAIVMLANMAQWAAIFGGVSRDDDEGGGGIVGLILMAILPPSRQRSSRWRSPAPGSTSRMTEEPRCPASRMVLPEPSRSSPGFPDRSDGCQPVDGPYVYRQPPDGAVPDEPVQYAPANRGADCQAAEHEDFLNPIKDFRWAGHVAGSSRKSFVSEACVMAEEKEGKGFVVRDRRLFDESGAPKEETVPPEAVSPSADEPAVAAEEPSPRQEAPREEPAPADSQREEASYPEVSFASFVVSLSTTVLYHFGDIPDPVTNKTERNLPAAKQTIDILGMLQRKTTGNLDEGEKALLDSALFELRMRYVKESASR